MSLLEDRLLRIIELRKQGHDSEAIGKELDISAGMVNNYENSFKRGLLMMVNREHCGLEDVSRKIGVSPIAIEVALNYYDISAPMGYGKISRTEENIGKICELVQKGTDVNEIAEIIGLKESTVRVYARKAGIKLPKTKREEYSIRESTKLKMNRIRELAESGVNSIEEIAEIIGLKKSTVRGYAYRNKIRLPLIQPHLKSKFDSEEAIAERVKGFLNNGVKSLEELCRKGKIGRVGLAKLIKQYNIELPDDLEAWKTKPEIDELINRGLSLRKIGEKVRLTREGIRQYIISSGQENTYKDRRKQQTKKFQINKRKQELGEILYVLERRTEELAGEEGWAYEKVVEYVNKHIKGRAKSRLRKHSFDDVLRIFQSYEKAKEKGEKLSLTELRDGTNIKYDCVVGSILKDVGIEPMYWKIENRQITPKHKKEAIKRSVNVKLNNTDIAYFLGLPFHVVNNNFRVWGLKDKKIGVPKAIKHFGFGESSKLLTYRLASEIYEGRHRCSFNNEELKEILNVNDNILDFAFKNELRIGREIVNALRVLYDDKSVDKPYKRSDF